MKRISIIITICSLSCPSLFSQEMLSLEQCRAMALKYNKEMAASIRQTESALYTVKSYKGNFFPNFTANGTGYTAMQMAVTVPAAATYRFSCRMLPDNFCLTAALPIFPVSI